LDAVDAVAAVVAANGTLLSVLADGVRARTVACTGVDSCGGRTRTRFASLLTTDGVVVDVVEVNAVDVAAAGVVATKSHDSFHLRRMPANAVRSLSTSATSVLSCNTASTTLLSVTSRSVTGMRVSDSSNCARTCHMTYTQRTHTRMPLTDSSTSCAPSNTAR
jgi:hypothetical protein